MLAASGVLERPVFTVGRRQFRWSDVAERFDWEAIPRPPGESDLDGAEARFRYERGLVAAEEMEGWLARWQIAVGDWREYLRGSADQGERGRWVSAVCSGSLERAAEDLAARAAAAEALGEPDLDRAFDRFVAQAVTPDALRTILEARKADWIRVDCRTLVLVDGKVEPSLDDPEILRRAQEAVRLRAIEREVVNRVTWHERV